MFGIALAAGMAAVTHTDEHHGDVRTLFSNGDYPAQAIRKGEQGEVVADLLINPSGAVETCTIILSSGFADLDQATCAVIQTRARFIPAKEAAGKATYDIFRTPPIIWSVGSFHYFPVPPDYDLMINRAPNGVTLPLEFKVDYLVTREAKIENCALSSDTPAPAELVTLACQAMASAPPPIVRDRDGVPVERHNQASFRFTLDKGRRK